MSPNPSPLELLRPVCLISALQVIARYLYHELSTSPIDSASLAERVGLPARKVDAALRAGVACGAVAFENGYKATEALYELNLSELDRVFTYAVAASQTVKDICTKEEAGFILDHGLLGPILRGPTPGVQQTSLVNLSDSVAIAAVFALIPGQFGKEACEFLIGRGFDSAAEDLHEAYTEDKPWTDVLRMFLIDAAPSILSIANHLSACKGPSCPLLLNARGDTVFEVVDRIRLNKDLSSLSKIFPIGSNVIADVARRHRQTPAHLIDVGGGDGSIASQWNIEDSRVIVQRTGQLKGSTREQTHYLSRRSTFSTSSPTLEQQFITSGSAFTIGEAVRSDKSWAESAMQWIAILHSFLPKRSFRLGLIVQMRNTSRNTSCWVVQRKERRGPCENGRKF